MIVCIVTRKVQMITMMVRIFTRIDTKIVTRIIKISNIDGQEGNWVS